MSARWRILVVVVAIPFAYACGWSANGVLNDDPCIEVYTSERNRYDYVDRWWPARTDCRVTEPSGASRIAETDATPFWATFAFWLVVAAAVVAPGREVVRAAVVPVAGVAALAVIFL